MATTGHMDDHGVHTSHQVSISLGQPFIWLRKGWEDMKHHQSISLFYGLVVAGMGLVIISIGRHPYFLAASISGFLLVGPLLTTGLCELSRRRQQGEALTFDGSLSALTRNRQSLESFAMILLALSVLWFLLSTLMLQQIYGSAAPAYGDTLWGDLLDKVTPAQMMSYAIVGGAMCAIVFALSVVSIPMIIDRHSTAGEAINISVKVTLSHLPTMVVWAGLIVLLVGIGFAPALLGLIIVFPLLGHATWHAYRDLVH